MLRGVVAPCYQGATTPRNTVRALIHVVRTKAATPSIHFLFSQLQTTRNSLSKLLITLNKMDLS